MKKSEEVRGECLKRYPDSIPWREVWIAVAQIAVVAAVFVGVYYVTRITPEREAELKAEGAAEAERKAATAGGWSAWIAGEINADGQDARRPRVASADGQDARRPRVANADGQDARRPRVASADGQDARRPSWEVR